jgi:hypothetical protein
MAKGKYSKKKIVQKDLTNIAAPAVVVTDSSNSPSTNVVQSAGTGSPAGSVGYWPAANLWYSQGSGAAKKVYYEYLSKLAQFEAVPADQVDQKLKLAGEMNSYAASVIQGVAIGLEALENSNLQIRAGNAAAIEEKKVVCNIMDKLLKIVWAHNSGARSGSFPGLEVQMLDSGLTGRIKRATEFEDLSDFGLPITNPAEAENLWTDPVQPPITDEMPVENAESEEVPGGSVDEESDSVPDTVPNEELQDNDLENQPLQTDDEDTELEIEDDENPEEDAEIPQDEITEAPVEPQLNGNQEVPMELPAIPEEQEETPLPQEEGEISEDDALKEQWLELFDENPERAKEILMEESPEEETTEEVETEEQEFPPEASEEVSEESEDKPIFCVECDNYVSEEDIAACENKYCPFHQEDEDDLEESDDVVEDEPDEEVDIEEEPDDEIIVEDDDEEIKPKHFILVDTNDHSEHNCHGFVVREFTGVEGEICLECQKTISYAFDQDTWAFDDAKKWVQKTFKNHALKTKSAEKIIAENFDITGDSIIKEFITEYRKSPDEEDDGLDIDLNELKEIVHSTMKAALIEEIIPFEQRLRKLEM